MGINKVIFNGNTLLDLTEDTVTAGDLVSGITAHNAAGNIITGSLVVPEPWEVVALMYGLGSAKGSASYALLSNRVKLFDDQYFIDSVPTGVYLRSYKAGYYKFICFPRGSNNSKANFRLDVGDDNIVLTMSGIVNAPGTDNVFETTQYVPQDIPIQILARNASSSSTSAYSCGVAIIYVGETLDG